MHNEPDQNATNPARELGRRARRFIGEDGREWDVEESPLPTYHPHSGACLVFRTEDAARRVRNFPRDWFDYSDADLYRLSLRD